MEEDLHQPQVYDYRQYDRVWQRVAPTLEPYPGMRQAASEAAEPRAEPPSPPAAPTPPESQPSTPPESQLPGAQPNPCCMGTAAGEMLEVITVFIEESLSDRQYFLAIARQGPAWARQKLRAIADDEAGHARRLLAVHYLITGQCYRPAVHHGPVCVGQWCAALRERYHLEACSGFNYARAADGTTDPCLSRLFNELSADEYRHADTILRLLERSLQG